MLVRGEIGALLVSVLVPRLMQRSLSRSFKAASVLFAVASLSVLGGAGCSKSEAATLRDRQTKVAGEAGTSAKVENENFKVELRSVGPYSKDAEGKFEVFLETKGEYHINEQYPYRFTPKTGVEGVSYKGPVGRESGNFDKTTATLSVPFTATKSGKVPVGGKLSLSVCSDKTCLMDKIDLEFEVDVK